MSEQRPPVKRKLRHTFTTRVSPAEDAHIRGAAATASERERKRITPSALIRRIVVAELADDLKGAVSTVAAE